MMAKTAKQRSARAPSEKRSGSGQPTGGTVASKSGAFKAVLPAGLYVVATPIGNLGDMTTRAIETLRAVDLIACEDTRVTGILGQRFALGTPLTPYHDHNADVARPMLLEKLQAGAAIALVSDAGTPLISDPGYKLVRACAEAGITVVPVPGPSAMLAALTVAALPTDRIFFAGFLPAKQAARRDAIADVKTLQATLVFYDSTQRLPETLADLAAVLGPRNAAVCRELTKLHEDIRRGTLDDLAKMYAAEGPPKGEVVIVVGGAEPLAFTADDVDNALRIALQTMSVRDAAASVAEALRQSRRALYARALELAKK